MSDITKRGSIRMRHIVSGVVAVALAGCTALPTPTSDRHTRWSGRSVYVDASNETKTLNLLISQEDFEKTSSAHFVLIGFLPGWFPVSIQSGHVVAEYLQECTRKVFKDVCVNGTGASDVVLTVSNVSLDLSALTGKASVALSVDSKLADGQPLLQQTYAAAGGSRGMSRWLLILVG